MLALALSLCAFSLKQQFTKLACCYHGCRLLVFLEKTVFFKICTDRTTLREKNGSKNKNHSHTDCFVFFYNLITSRFIHWLFITLTWMFTSTVIQFLMKSIIVHFKQCQNFSMGMGGWYQTINQLSTFSCSKLLYQHLKTHYRSTSVLHRQAHDG